jgi:endoglucanase
MHGINLAGGEFKPEILPGQVWKDYVYPDRSVADPFVKHGFDTVRLPVLWERIQPEPFKPLSDSEIALVDASIKELDGFSTILLDIHNYAYYRGQRLDKIDRGGAMLADLWTRLAQHYAGSPNMAFGIMNEPHDIDAWAWRKIADETVAAIRAAGAKNLLFIPGTSWTGAHSWTAGGENSNAAAFQTFRDPGNNFIFELHQYLDPDSSGTTSACVESSLARERMVAVTQWLRDRKAKGFLAEFGSPQSGECLKSLGALMDYMNANNDVWAGWTYWAGGPWWGNYMLSIQPDQGQDKPQMRTLLDHMNRK